MTPAAADPIAHFVAKWQQREPEMRIAEVFCPAAGRARFSAWGALLHELRETLFELSDERITGVKTAWWAEEMMGIGQGRQRHPLSAELLGLDAPWSSLGRALIEGGAIEHRAADTGQAIAQLLPLAQAVIAVEDAIFAASGGAQAAQALAVHWLGQRLPLGLASADQARIPMHLLARHGVTAAQLAAGQAEPLLRDWGRELAQAMPVHVGSAALIRRSRHRLDQARLMRLAAGKGFSEPAAPVTLWRAWRAARGQ